MNVLECPQENSRGPLYGRSEQVVEREGGGQPAGRHWPLFVFLPQALQILPVFMDGTKVSLLYLPRGQAYNGKWL